MHDPYKMEYVEGYGLDRRGRGDLCGRSANRRLDTAKRACAGRLHGRRCRWFRHSGRRRKRTTQLDHDARLVTKTSVVVLEAQRRTHCIPIATCLVDSDTGHSKARRVAEVRDQRSASNLSQRRPRAPADFKAKRPMQRIRRIVPRAIIKRLVPSYQRHFPLG